MYNSQTITSGLWYLGISLHSAFGIKPRMRYSFAHFQKKEEQNYTDM